MAPHELNRPSYWLIVRRRPFMLSLVAGILGVVAWHLGWLPRDTALWPLDLARPVSGYSLTGRADTVFSSSPAAPPSAAEPASVVHAAPLPLMPAPPAAAPMGPLVQATETSPHKT